MQYLHVCTSPLNKRFTLDLDEVGVRVLDRQVGQRLGVGAYVDCYHPNRFRKDIDCSNSLQTSISYTTSSTRCATPTGRSGASLVRAVNYSYVKQELRDEI